MITLIVIVVYVALQFLESNVLVPLVMKNTIGLSPFIVIVSLLIGAAVAGVVGALLSVPIAASVEVVLERLQARDVPVAQEPSAGQAAPDSDVADAQGRTLPDSRAGISAR